MDLGLHVLCFARLMELGLVVVAVEVILCWLKVTTMNPSHRGKATQLAAAPCLLHAGAAAGRHGRRARRQPSSSSVWTPCAT